MSNTKKIVGLIREIVKQEVQKEVRKILISEGAKAISNNVNDVPEVIPKPVPQKSKPEEVSYTKNPTLNKILNETARGDIKLARGCGTAFTKSCGNLMYAELKVIANRWGHKFRYL